jgi:hypothetical protein
VALFPLFNVDEGIQTSMWWSTIAPLHLTGRGIITELYWTRFESNLIIAHDAAAHEYTLLRSNVGV